MTPISTTPIFAATDHVSQQVDPLCVDLNGELAILDSASGFYFGLDEVGADVWRSIGNGTTVSEIVARILTLYKVDPDECEKDVHELLHEMRESNLVRIDEATA